VPGSESYIGRRPVAAGELELDPTWGISVGDRDFWAQSLTRAKKKHGKKAPGAVDLENAITGIKITDTIKGSSTITLTIQDPEWQLTDSGFFDSNEDGKLDTLDVEYPEDSDVWWRCTQIGIDANRAGAKIEMTFMERAATYLLRKKGPKKTRRGKVTRAEFLKSLVGEVKAGGGLHFRCRQLHRKQPIAKPVDTVKEKKAKKEKGIHKDDDVTVKGKQANATQIRNIEIVLGVCDDLKAPKLAVQAILCAGIGESQFTPTATAPSTGAKGVFQLMPFWWDQFDGNGWSDTAGQAKYFLTKGFTGKPGTEGGAIGMAKRGDYTPGEMATMLEGSGEPGAFYGQFLPEAKAMINGNGGLGTGDQMQKKAYNFEVGSDEEPHETYWDAMNRLADEVGWALFVDGRNIYYDPETSLIQQQPAAIIHRLDPDLVRFTSNWDARQIATEATLELICSPFEFRAGEVFKLSGFGPASSGSTADLPGRWLIEEIERDRFEMTSTFTLKQPAKPKAEPANEREAKEDEDDDGNALKGSKRDKIVEAAKRSLSSRTGHNRYSQAGALTDDPTPKAPNRSDCSQWSRAIYLKAGCPDIGGNSGAQMSGPHAHRTSNPKPGDIICSASHVEIYIGDGKTIGHGDAKINYGEAGYYIAHMGMDYYTFDFLGEDKAAANAGTPSARQNQRRSGDRR
jgi:hypothetical protein